MYTTACSNITYPDRSGEYESPDLLVAEEGMTLGFRHLDVMLAVGVEGSGPSRFSVGLAMLDIERPEFALPRVGGDSLQFAGRHATTTKPISM